MRISLDTAAGPVEVDGAEDMVVRPCPGGPVLVRGAASVVGTDGESQVARRPVVAVCACGKTSRGAWCDGTHKVIPRTRGIGDG